MCELGLGHTFWLEIAVARSDVPCTLCFCGCEYPTSEFSATEVMGDAYGITRQLLESVISTSIRIGETCVGARSSVAHNRARRRPSQLLTVVRVVQGMLRELIHIGDLRVKIYRLIECTRSAGVSVVGASHILRIGGISHVRPLSSLCIVSFQVDSFPRGYTTSSPRLGMFIACQLDGKTADLDFARARLSRAIK